MTRQPARSWRRLALLVVVCAAALQATLFLRVATMRFIDPESTAFQRSEAWRLGLAGRPVAWQQQWVPYERISTNLKRAVIAAEDAGFSEHSGVEWDALEKAWERNQRAEAVTDRLNERAARNAAHPERAAKVVGGSTITQQLAKNLFLGGERTLPRKAEELLLTYAIEALLDKRRILEIYLNSVEWGEGVFGAEAAARRYFKVGAGQLSAQQAAQLAVMLPAPKRFEKRPASPYVMSHAATIVARMPTVALP